jgi:cysteine desulfurase
MIRQGIPPTEPIYADYQASTPVDPRVVESIAKCFRECPGNPHSEDHAVGWRAAAAVDDIAAQSATILGCDPDEIVFTSGATESNNLAILGLAARAPADRRRIIVSAIEHKSVLAAASAARDRYGCTLETIPVDREGVIDLKAAERMIAPDVLLVSVMAVNSEIGSLQPVAELAYLCAGFGTPLHTDAAQAPVAGLAGTEGAQLISLSAHKMYGPQGIGVLRVAREVQRLIEPLIYGGGQQQGLRSGTLPVPLIVGLGGALTLMCSPDADDERRRVGGLRDAFVERVMGLSGRVHLNGPPLARRHPGNCNLRFDGVDGRDLLGKLQPHLAASTGSACSSGIPEPSHVLTAIGLDEQQARSSVRFSFGRFSTLDDIDRAVSLVAQALNDSY